MNELRTHSMIPLGPFRAAPRTFPNITKPAIPYLHNIDITAARKKLSIISPLETTDLSCMASLKTSRAVSPMIRLDVSD